MFEFFHNFLYNQTTFALTILSAIALAFVGFMIYSTHKGKH